MSVVISTPSLPGVSGAVVCIKKARLNAPSIFGSSEFYVILTATGHLYYTRALGTQAPTEISLTNIPDRAQKTYTGFDVYSAVNDDSTGLTYPVIMLHGNDAAGYEPDPMDPLWKVYGFTAVLRCWGVPSQPPTVSMLWGEIVTNSRSDSANSFIGHLGENSSHPDGFALFTNTVRASFGTLFSNLGTEVGVGQGVESALVNQGGGYSLSVINPVVSIMPGVKVNYLPGPVAELGGGVQYTAAQLVPIADYETIGSPNNIRVAGLLVEESSEVGGDTTFVLEEMLPTKNIASYSDGVSFYDWMWPLSDADRTWLKTAFGLRHIAVGWDLGGISPPPPEATVGFFGGPSVILVTNDGYIRVCGSGSGSTQFTTPLGAESVDAICCGIEGRMSTCLADVVSLAVVAVAGSNVMYSLNGINWNSTPALVLPARAANSINNTEIKFRTLDNNPFFEEAGVPDAAFWLTTVYESAETGEEGDIYYEVHSSVDGLTWVQFYRVNLSASIQADLPAGYSWVVSDFGGGEHSKVINTASTMGVILGIKATKAASPTYYYAAGVAWYSVEGVYDWSPVRETITDNGSCFAPGGVAQYLSNSPVLLSSVDGINGVELDDTLAVFGSWNGVTIPLDTADAFYNEGTSYFGLSWLPDGGYALGGSSVEVYVSSTMTAAGVLINTSRVGLRVAMPTYDFSGNLLPRGITPVERIPLVPGDSLDQPDFSFSAFHTTYELGSLAFLTTPSGAATHFYCSQSSIVDALSNHRGEEAQAAGGVRIIQLGFPLNSLCPLNSGTAYDSTTILYMTGKDGVIYSMAPGGAEVVPVTDYFFGQKNLRLSNVNGIWVASLDGYDGETFINTVVFYSLDLITWFSGVEFEQLGLPAGLLAKAVAILPLGSVGNKENRIPGSGAATDSIFYHAIL